MWTQFKRNLSLIFNKRDDFEVSCKELDSLVEIARRSEGVYGSRLTGGGFGGCTVTLVKRENVQELIQNIIRDYEGEPTFYVCRPCNGAQKIE
jgi:galactokinase